MLRRTHSGIGGRMRGESASLAGVASPCGRDGRYGNADARGCTRIGPRRADAVLGYLARAERGRGRREAPGEGASGRTGGGRRQSRRCRGPSGVCAAGVLAGATAEQPPVQADEEAGEVAAIGDDGLAEFVPECPVALAGRDAEVTADIGDDGGPCSEAGVIEDSRARSVA